MNLGNRPGRGPGDEPRGALPHGRRDPRRIQGSGNRTHSPRPGTGGVATGGPLAASHGTRYPIVQGPMTRVSDTAPFAKAVADAGGLPFLALALMGKDESLAPPDRDRGSPGRPAMGRGNSWLRAARAACGAVEAIRGVKPPYAIIAGGRPDQAQALESEGIATYLHVPSPGLLHLPRAGRAALHLRRARVRRPRRPADQLRPVGR